MKRKTIFRRIVLAAFLLVVGPVSPSIRAETNSACVQIKNATLKSYDRANFIRLLIRETSTGEKQLFPRRIGDTTGVYEDNGKQRIKISKRGEFVRRGKKAATSEQIFDCKNICSEKIDDQGTDVYTYRAENSPSEATIWIGKDDGLPYRTPHEDFTLIATSDE